MERGTARLPRRVLQLRCAGSVGVPPDARQTRLRASVLLQRIQLRLPESVSVRKSGCIRGVCRAEQLEHDRDPHAGGLPEDSEKHGAALLRHRQQSGSAGRRISCLPLLPARRREKRSAQDCDHEQQKRGVFSGKVQQRCRSGTESSHAADRCLGDVQRHPACPDDAETSPAGLGGFLLEGSGRHELARVVCRDERYSDQHLRTRSRHRRNEAQRVASGRQSHGCRKRDLPERNR